jgi:hypothetical protein
MAQPGSPATGPQVRYQRRSCRGNDAPGGLKVTLSGSRLCIAARANLQFPTAQPLEASGSVNRQTPATRSPRRQEGRARPAKFRG